MISALWVQIPRSLLRCKSDASQFAAGFLTQKRTVGDEWCFPLWKMIDISGIE